jgi:uncharacterized repeat protein (TIGR03803 family)
MRTVLYSFTGGADRNPNGYSPTLLRDELGNLYGTTWIGGDLNVVGDPHGCGVVYKVTPSAHAWGTAPAKETVLYSFTGGADGCQPDPFGPLIQDVAGNLYGVTQGGGGFYQGTVYKLNRAGKETVLYTFTGGTDGGVPGGGLVRDCEGNLYGTTTTAPPRAAVLPGRELCSRST